MNRKSHKNEVFKVADQGGTNTQGGGYSQLSDNTFPDDFILWTRFITFGSHCQQTQRLVFYITRQFTL